jgi:hypothetical protein
MLPVEPHHLVVPSGAYKMISEPMVGKPRTYLAPTRTLSPNGKKRDSTWSTSLGVPSGASKTISEPMVRSMQTVHLSYVKISTIPKLTEHSLGPRHQGVPSGVSKMISKPMVRLAQTVHLSALTLTLSPNGKKWDSTWSTSPRSTIVCIQNDFQAYGTFDANREPILHPN